MCLYDVCFTAAEHYGRCDCQHGKLQEEKHELAWFSSRFLNDNVTLLTDVEHFECVLESRNVVFGALSDLCGSHVSLAAKQSCQATVTYGLASLYDYQECIEELYTSCVIESDTRDANALYWHHARRVT